MVTDLGAHGRDWEVGLPLDPSTWWRWSAPSRRRAPPIGAGHLRPAV